MIKRLNQWIAALVLLFASGCTAAAVSEPATNPETTAEPVAEEAPQESEQAKPGDIEILYTSDTHCGVRTGFGMEGLYQIRDTLKKKGVTTLLVDDGDAIQGDVIGTLTKGNAIIRLMNELQYDVAIPGNHEFDYGTENFLELTESADFPYLSCNFTHDGELVFEPYLIKEAAGKKIAFIGLTTPKTLTSSSPSHFQDETGEFR